MVLSAQRFACCLLQAHHEAIKGLFLLFVNGISMGVTSEYLLHSSPNRTCSSLSSKGIRIRPNQSSKTTVATNTKVYPVSTPHPSTITTTPK